MMPSPRSTQKSLLQRSHDLGLARPAMVVAEQVAQAVDGQTSHLAGKPALAAAPESGLDRDGDVAEEDPVTGRVGFSAQFLLVEAEHVGGPVELTVVTVERPYLVVAGEQQGNLAARTIEQAQGLAHPCPEFRAGRAGKQPARLGPDQHLDLVHSTRL